METLTQTAARIARRYRKATIMRHWGKIIEAAAKRDAGPMPSQEYHHNNHTEHSHGN